MNYFVDKIYAQWPHHKAHFFHQALVKIVKKRVLKY